MTLHILNQQTSEVLPPFRDPIFVVSNETNSATKAKKFINNTIVTTNQYDGNKGAAEIYQNLQDALTLVRLIKGVLQRNSLKQHEKSENKVSCPAIAPSNYLNTLYN